MIETVEIIPTGDELKNGVVLDTDSPMLMQQLLRMNNNCTVRRWAVTRDTLEAIAERIRRCVEQEPDLVILIGGSGSGHLHSEVLGKDYTHAGMESLMDDFAATSLYGKNGHMWSRLVCGYIGKTLVMNVPGPFVEAQAAIKAFCGLWETEEIPSLSQINNAMAAAVAKCYERYETTAAAPV